MGQFETYQFIHNFGLYNKTDTAAAYNKDILRVHNNRITDLSVTERYIYPSHYFAILTGWVSAVANTDMYSIPLSRARVSGYYFWNSNYKYIKTPSWSEWHSLVEEKISNNIYDCFTSGTKYNCLSYTEGIASTVTRVDAVYSAFSENKTKSKLIEKQIKKQGIELIYDTSGLDIDTYTIFPDIRYPKKITKEMYSRETSPGSKRKYICGMVALHICSLRNFDLILNFFRKDWDKIVDICSTADNTDILIRQLDKVLFPYYKHKVWRGMGGVTKLRENLIEDIWVYGINKDTTLDTLHGDLFPIEAPSDREHLGNNIMYKPSPVDYIQLLRMYFLDKEVALWLFWSIMGIAMSNGPFRNMVTTHIAENNIRFDLNNFYHVLERL